MRDDNIYIQIHFLTSNQQSRQQVNHQNVCYAAKHCTNPLLFLVVWFRNVRKLLVGVLQICFVFSLSVNLLCVDN